MSILSIYILHLYLEYRMIQLHFPFQNENSIKCVIEKASQNISIFSVSPSLSINRLWTSFQYIKAVASSDLIVIIYLLQCIGPHKASDIKSLPKYLVCFIVAASLITLFDLVAELCPRTAPAPTLTTSCFCHPS